MCAKKRKAELGKLAAARRQDMFYVLGEPTRRRLVELIAQGEQPLGRLVTFFQSTRQAVSDHLYILRQAGLVRTRFAGRQRFFRLRPARLGEIHAWLAHCERLSHRNHKTFASARSRRG